MTQSEAKILIEQGYKVGNICWAVNAFIQKRSDIPPDSNYVLVDERNFPYKWDQLSEDGYTYIPAKMTEDYPIY